MTREKLFSVLQDDDGILLSDFLLDAFAALGPRHPLRKIVLTSRVYQTSELEKLYSFTANELAALAYKTQWTGTDAIICIESLRYLHSVPTDSMVKMLRRSTYMEYRKLRSMADNLTNKHLSEWVASRVRYWRVKDVLYEVLVYECDNSEYMDSLWANLGTTFTLVGFEKRITTPVPPVVLEMFEVQKRWGKRTFINTYLGKTYDNRNKES